MPGPRPLRIVHVTSTPTGAPWMIAFLVEQKRLGHDVAAIIPSLDGTIAPALAAAGIPCYAVDLDALSKIRHTQRIAAILRLARLLRRLRPDVVHSHILGAVVSARIASWLVDVPRHFGGIVGPLSLESPLYRPMELGTVFGDTTTIASCQYTYDLLLAEGVPKERLALIYYAVDQSGHDPALADGARVRRELGIPDGAPVIGKVAYFYSRATSAALMMPNLIGRGLKGHDVLIRAVPRVLESVPDAKFVLVGRGWGDDGVKFMQELKDLAKTLGVEHAVLFPGERKDVPDTLASFDISVHCSLTDNLAGTVESLLMERPMVVSNIPGFADTVLHEKTGLVVPVDDPPALADALVRLLRDPALAKQLGTNGRKWMLERFMLNRSVADLDELLASDLRRAEQHYRLRKTVVRAMAAPFKLWPIVREVRSVLRRAGFGLRPRFMLRTRYAIRQAIKPATASRRADGKVRVAQVAGSWHSCPWFVDLCRGLTERGYEVIAIIDDRPGDLAGRLAAHGIRVHKLAMTFATRLDRARLPIYALRIPLAALRLARILRRERIDIVHSHIFVSTVIARLAAALARTKHVAMAPTPRHLESPVMRATDRLTWWLDDVTIAGCKLTRELYTSLGANEERMELVYYGTDAERFDPARADAAAVRAQLGVAADAPLVSIIAQFYTPTRGAQTPRNMLGIGVKGHHDFLSAARTIAERLPSARFVLAGSGVMETGETYRQRLIEQCRNDDLLRDRVIFTGHFADVPSLLAASDVTVQCSLAENLGGTIEALLMARPIVATRVGGMPESVRDGETGLLVPPSDPAALAAAILRLLEHREEANALGQAGRRFMLERFTSARMADDVAAIYARLETSVVPNVVEGHGRAVAR
jgi:glycosyltransferase involved in cell wall biosynthesis